MQQLKHYQKLVIDNLKDIFSGYKAEIKELYEPIIYALEGGKKIRPVSVIMAADVFDGNLQQAIIPAFAVEMFHNFTLLHDDVMDNSPVRRNRQTVHAKWDANQAILSGDAMMILVYQKLLELPTEKVKPVMELINKTALQVCEGQQLDMDFETNLNVPLEKYMQMIKLKTAVLLAASLALGAIIANADKKDIQEIYNFGINIGLAFQIQDDYFDTFGDFETFGKKIGNDIVTNKKTFLLISALNLAEGESKTRLEKLFIDKTFDEKSKIDNVKEIFYELQIPEIAQNQIHNYYQKAIKNIDNIKRASTSKKEILYKFAEHIVKREK
ncbi:MAG: polyprenyl synthetase family protein [Bacteroidales bacterium]|nr:polyprenyl synthetase family protein [Bacteroidales bacterium]